MPVPVPRAGLRGHLRVLGRRRRLRADLPLAARALPRPADGRPRHELRKDRVVGPGRVRNHPRPPPEPASPAQARLLSRTPPATCGVRGLWSWASAVGTDCEDGGVESAAREFGRQLGPLRRALLRATGAEADLPDLPDAPIEAPVRRCRRTGRPADARPL